MPENKRYLLCASYTIFTTCKKKKIEKYLLIFSPYLIHTFCSCGNARNQSSFFVHSKYYLLHASHPTYLAFLLYLYCAHHILCLFPLNSNYLFCALWQKTLKNISIYLCCAHLYAYSLCMLNLHFLFLPMNHKYYESGFFFVHIKYYLLYASHPTYLVLLMYL